MTTSTTVVTAENDETSTVDTATPTAVEAAVTAAVAATVAATSAEDVREAEASAEQAATVSTVEASTAVQAASRAESAADESRYNLETIHSMLEELPQRITAALNPPAPESDIADEIPVAVVEDAPDSGNWLTRKWFG